MQRTALLDKLSLVGKALSTKDFIPALTQFVFNSDSVTAFNSLVAITAKIEVPVIGGIKGKTLLDYISSVKGNEVSIERRGTEDNVDIKSGRSVLTMPISNTEQFVFKFPDVLSPSYTKVCDLNSLFFNNLDSALQSAGSNPHSQKTLGVTVSFAGSKIMFYSTDNKSLTKISMELDAPTADPTFIIPTEMCKVMVELGNKLGAAKLYTNADKSAIILVFRDGEYQVFSKVINETPFDFESAMKSVGFDLTTIKSAPLPVDFAPTIDLIKTICGDDSVCLVTACDEFITFDVDSSPNKFEHSIFLKEVSEPSEPVAYSIYRLKTGLVANGISNATEFALTDAATFLHNPATEYVYICSNQVS